MIVQLEKDLIVNVDQIQSARHCGVWTRVQLKGSLDQMEIPDDKRIIWKRLQAACAPSVKARTGKKLTENG